MLPLAKARLALALLTLLLFGQTTLAQSRPDFSDLPPKEDALGVPTLGGLQFWGDEYLFHQWRIQRHVSLDKCRLLDANNQQHAFGSYEECRNRLDALRRHHQLPPMQGHAVILLHGLGATRLALTPLAEHLRNKGKMQVLTVGYPSTQRSIDDHAKILGRLIEDLDGVTEISFVAHSLGNIVLRRYLAEIPKDDPDGLPDPRIKRIVMIGPPNNGSTAAVSLEEYPAVAGILGSPLAQLGREWPWLESRLAVPKVPFGIIAGGMNNNAGFNPLLPGDDDGLVTVATTKLPGATDFVLVPTLHRLLLSDARAKTYALNFLTKERFKP